MDLVKVSAFFIVSVLGIAFRTAYCGDGENDDSSSGEDEVFQATNEWKPLKKDQAIPRGLHVRLNLQTGEREAKLLDPNEDEGKDKEQRIFPVDKSVDDLNQILRNMEDAEEAMTEEDFQKIKEKFRSYEDLKKDMEKMEMVLKTDMEIMRELIDRYKENKEFRSKNNPLSSQDEKALEIEEVKILTDLEYLVHQYDNAKEFARLNGVTDVVFASLNSTSVKVRYEAVKLLGSAVQSNPKVQIHALESGSISVLLRSIALDSSAKVQSGALYALACLIRRFPAAQARLIDQGGLAALSKLFEGETSDRLNLQVKVVSLLSDLLEEKLMAEASVMMAKNGTGGSVSNEELEKLRQYTNIALGRRMTEENWCKRIALLLLTQGISWSEEMKAEDIACATDPDVPLRSEHERVEKIVKAMVGMADFCKDTFAEPEVSAVIQLLASWYSDLSLRERDPEGIFTNLFHLIDSLARKVDIFYKTKLKDEL